MKKIDPTARIEDGAVIGDGTTIGPYCIIGSNVVIGANCKLIAHVHVIGQTTIGANCTIYPGVMMIEAMAQTAGVIGIKSVEGTERPRAVYFLTIDKCKFRKPVMPGDTIEYHMRSLGRRNTMWWFHGDAKVNGVVMAQADVGAMLTD